MSRTVEEIFKEDVKNHEMKVLNDNGVYRHIRFSRPESSAFCFDLVTWPNHLSISGDCGTFVFSRLHDMFEFFTGKKPNLHYWGQKLESVNKYSASTYNNGYSEWLSDLFWKNLKECFSGYYDEKAEEKMAEFKQDSISFDHNNPYECHNAVYEFNSELDFWEYDCTEFTHTYQWCCWAILWGIKQYKEQQQEATP